MAYICDMRSCTMCVDYKDKMLRYSLTWHSALQEFLHLQVHMLMHPDWRNQVIMGNELIIMFPPESLLVKMYGQAAWFGRKKSSSKETFSRPWDLQQRKLRKVILCWGAECSPYTYGLAMLDLVCPLQEADNPEWSRHLSLHWPWP